MTIQKQNLIEWLNHPITKQWHKRLQEDKKDLEESLLYTSRTSFCDGNFQRTRDELEIHYNLIALDLNLRVLNPLFDFMDYCSDKSLDPLEEKETYERLEVGKSEPTILENPLYLFIKNQ